MDKLLEILEEYKSLHTALGNEHKARAYSRVIYNIKNSRNVTLANVINVDGVGDGIERRIEEFIETGEDPADLTALRKGAKSIEVLQTVRGVGPETAKEWVFDHDIHTVTDLRRAHQRDIITLNEDQQFGVRWYKDLTRPIPRAEVTRIIKRLKTYARDVQKDIIFVGAGSYRRGKLFSSDVDIITSTYPFIPNFIHTFIEHLWEETDIMMKVFAQGNYQASIVIFFEGMARQVDIIHVSEREFTAALNYFTGSKEHNERMRAKAKSLGYKLNRYGLFDKDTGNRFILPDERALYEKLEEDWLEPEDR